MMSLSFIVIPAKAETQASTVRLLPLGPRFRGDDVAGDSGWVTTIGD
jgi:hypothetical protein